MGPSQSTDGVPQAGCCLDGMHPDEDGLCLDRSLRAKNTSMT